MEDGLHLHRLEHDDRGSGLDLVADPDRGGDHEGRGRRPQHPALVAGDAVGDAVDLDQGGRSVGGGHDAVPSTTDHEAPMELVHPVQLSVDGLAEAGSGDRDLVARRAGVEGRHQVGGAAQLDLDPAADLVLDLRAAARGGLEQVRDLELDLVPVGLDGGGDDRDAGVGLGDQPPLGAHPVDPTGVGPAALAVDDLGLCEEVEHEALVARTTLDHDGGLAHGPPQPRQRLVAVAADGDDLGDHRVEVGRDGVALGDTGVDAYAGSRRQVEPDDAAGRRREVAVRVLGVEPRLDGVAGLGRLGGVQVGEPPTAGDVDLSLHQVDAGGRLGDRVLHLQAGVDLEEGEGPGRPGRRGTPRCRRRRTRRRARAARPTS